MVEQQLEIKEKIEHKLFKLIKARFDLFCAYEALCKIDLSTADTLDEQELKNIQSQILDAHSDVVEKY